MGLTHFLDHRKWWCCVCVCVCVWLLQFCCYKRCSFCRTANIRRQQGRLFAQKTAPWQNRLFRCLNCSWKFYQKFAVLCYVISVGCYDLFFFFFFLLLSLTPAVSPCLMERMSCQRHFNKHGDLGSVKR